MILNNPPIVAAFCQIKYERDAAVLTRLASIANEVEHFYPIRTDHFSAEIGGLDEVIKKGVGETSFRATSKAQLNRVEFRSKDQQKKLIISEEFIFFSDETKYSCWGEYRSSLNEIFQCLDFVLKGLNIDRVSLRYVNRFVFDQFDDPTEFFTTTISSSSDYKDDGDIFKYGFRLLAKYPSSNIVSNVNHSLDIDPFNKYNYILDIDVLDHSRLVYDKETIMSNLDAVNEKLTDIFFNSITEKTRNLCN